MSWWKKAKLETFKDRNYIHERIDSFESIYSSIEYIAKLVHQTQRGARRMLNQISDEKILSSYDSILNLLAKADSSAMDSPNSFEKYCQEALKEIQIKISELKEQLEQFNNKTLPDRLKGFIDE